MFEETEQAAAMRAAGAVDYFSKSASFDSVLTAIRACGKGEGVGSRPKMKVGKR